jgi:hypothetical protein
MQIEHNRIGFLRAIICGDINRILVVPLGNRILGMRKIMKLAGGIIG